MIAARERPARADRARDRRGGPSWGRPRPRRRRPRPAPGGDPRRAAGGVRRASPPSAPGTPRGRSTRGRAATAAGPLVGVPTAIKDLTATAGVPTGRGSVVTRGWVPDARRRPRRAAARGGHGEHREDGRPGVRAALLHRARGSAARRHAVGHGPVGGRLVRAARRPRWRPGWCRSRRAPTAAARSGSRPRCAGSSGSRRPAGGSPRARRAAIRPGCRWRAPSRARSPTRRRCSTRCAAGDAGRANRSCRPRRPPRATSASPAAGPGARLRIGLSTTPPFGDLAALLGPASTAAVVDPVCAAAAEDTAAAAGLARAHRGAGRRCASPTRRSRPS